MTASGSGAATPGRPTSNTGRSASTSMACAGSSRPGAGWSGASGYTHRPAGIGVWSRPATDPPSAGGSTAGCQRGAGNRRPTAGSDWPPPSDDDDDLAPNRHQPSSANNVPPEIGSKRPAGARTSNPACSARTAAGTCPEVSGLPPPGTASRTTARADTTANSASATSRQSTDPLGRPLTNSQRVKSSRPTHHPTLSCTARPLAWACHPPWPPSSWAGSVQVRRRKSHPE